MVSLEIADIIGIVAFAFSGFLVATRDKLDLLGIFIASFLTALGGGILRDTMANKVPFTFSHFLPTLLVIGVIILSILFKLHKKNRLENTKYFILSDSIGLVSFSITGATMGILVGFNVFGGIMLALATAVGGGAMRDMLLNKVPVVLTSELYGSISIMIGVIIYLLDYINELNFMSTLIVFILFLCFRLLAYYKGWHLPKLD